MSRRTEHSPRRPRRRRHGLALGLSLFVPMVLGCLLVPVFWRHGANDLVAAPYLPPSREYPFGTDGTGRDLVARVFQGGRLDLLIAFVVVSLSLMVGTVVGVVSAMSRPWVDTTLMRFIDALLSFPFLVLILALTVVIGPVSEFGPFAAGSPAIIVAIVAVNWAVYARLARAQAMSLRSRDFITAAGLLGYSRTRLLVRHLAPNVVGVSGAYAASDAILVVVTTASLSFLGLGIQPPTAEWGSIMFEGRAVLATSWWITVMPGIALACTGVGLSLIADSLVDRGARR